MEDFCGKLYIRHEIEVNMPESLFAKALSDIQKEFPEVKIGSYPKLCGNKTCGKICLSTQDKSMLNRAKEAVQAMLQHITPR